MTIKQEFKTLVKIMIEDQAGLRLEENYKQPYCEFDGMCDCDKECDKCNHHKIDVYDLGIIQTLEWNNKDDEYELYKFHKSKYDCDTVILTRKKMYVEIKRLQKKISKRYDNEIAYLHRHDILEKYAFEFFQKVVNEFKLMINTKIMPIKFFDGDKRESPAEIAFREFEGDEEPPLGEFSHSPHTAQHQINIYNCEMQFEKNEDRIQLLQIVRHEILHYILYISSLMCKDKDGIFQALCKIYDANAYTPMNEQQQEICNHFLFIYNNIDKLIKQKPYKDSKKMILHYMLRYLGRIPWDVNEELVKYCEPIYKSLVEAYA